MFFIVVVLGRSIQVNLLHFPMTLLEHRTPIATTSMPSLLHRLLNSAMSLFHPGNSTSLWRLYS
jgi:hypothetical protein